MENSKGILKRFLKRKKIGLIILFFFLVAFLALIFITKINNKDSINTKGISLYYRVYTEDGYSKWYKNGQIAGYNNKKILGFEAKVESDYNGNIYYNTFGIDNNFDDNDAFNGELSGDKKNNIYAIKIGITDDLYTNYKLFYRTYNKKDGWLDWASVNQISGDNEVNIEKIQIKIVSIDDKEDFNITNSSKGFNEGA